MHRRGSGLEWHICSPHCLPLRRLKVCGWLIEAISNFGSTLHLTVVDIDDFSNVDTNGVHWHIPIS